MKPGQLWILQPWGEEPENVTKLFKQQQKDALGGTLHERCHKLKHDTSHVQVYIPPTLLPVKISTWK